MGKIIKVTDDYRINPASFIPGGSIVETVNDKGIRAVYDKIKNPEAYIKRITKDPSILEVYVDGEIKFSKNKK